MTNWTLKEVKRCLSINLLDDIVAELSEKEQKDFECLERSEKLDELFSSLFAKSARISEFYDSVDDFKTDLKNIRETPNLCRYGNDKPGEIDNPFLKNKETVIYKSEKNENLVSKNDVARMFCHFYFNTKLETITTLIYQFWSEWFFCETMRKDFDNCYELVDYSIWDSIENSLKNNNFKPKYKNVDFEELRLYFGSQPEVFDDVMNKYVNRLIECSLYYNDLDSITKAYFESVQVIETTIAVHQKFIEIFQPFSKSSKYQLPYVRCFHIVKPPTNVDKFYLAVEVSAALKILRKNLNLTIDVETEEERKLGIVRFMNEQQFEELLKSHDISKNELSIVNLETARSSNSIIIPFVSSYGTLIKPAIEGLLDILSYLIQNMRLFRHIKEDALKEVVGWIKKNCNFFLNNTRHAIEVWKITELIDKAKNELTKYKPNSEIFQVPQKSEYKKKEVIEYVRKMMRPFNLNIELFESLYAMLGKMTKKTIHQLYEICLKVEILRLLKIEPEKFSEIKEPRKHLEELKVSSENEKNSIEPELKMTAENSKNSEFEELRMKFEEELKSKNSEIEELRLKFKEELKLKNAEIEELRSKSEEDRKLKDTENKKLRLKFEKDMKLQDAENEQRCLKIEEDLKMAETSKTIEIERLSKENHSLRLKYEEDLESKNAENERLRQKFSNALKMNNSEVEKLSEENQKLHEKMQKFEKFFKTSIIEIKNREKLRNSERVFSLNYDGFTDSIYANLHKIMKKFPKNAEIRELKEEMDGFDENFDEYIENIREEIERIQENPNSDEEEIEEEIRKLVEKCRDLIDS